MIVNLKPFANPNALQATEVLNRNLHWKNHAMADIEQTGESRAKARGKFQLSHHHWFISYDWFLCL